MKQDEVYIGARYVPVFADDPWSNEREYEALTVVLHEGNSYTSRQHVPVGIDISNGQYWALTGNYNAQIDELEGDIQGISEIVEDKPFAFDTVALMQACENLSPGDICHTNGFHASGDGGASWYVISDALPNGMTEANGMDVIECGNLFAKLQIINDWLAPQQIGALADGNTDNGPHINRIFDLVHIAYFPNGNYKIATQVVQQVDHYMVSQGKVIIYCANLNPTIQIKGFTDHGYEDASWSYKNTKQPLISGGFTFMGPGRDSGTCIALGLSSHSGYESDNRYDAIETYLLENVGIWDFNIAVIVSAYNNYLGTFRRFHIERCETAFQLGYNGMLRHNSWEKMAWEDCILSNVAYAVYFYEAGGEFHFNNCSFDFCNDCFYGDTEFHRDYQAIFINGCHIEGTRHGCFLDTGNFTYIFISDTRLDITGRPILMFSGKGQLTLENNPISSSLYEHMPNLFFSTMLYTHIKSFNPPQDLIYSKLLSDKNNLVKDGSFKNTSFNSSPVSGNINELLKFGSKSGNVTSVTTEDETLFISDGKKLVLDINSSVDYYYFIIEATVPVDGGCWYMTKAVAKLVGSNKLRINTKFIWLDINDDEISSTDSWYARPSIDANIWEDSTAVRCGNAPANAVKAKIQFNFTNPEPLTANAKIEIAYLHVEKF